MSVKTATQIASELGVTADSVRRWVKQGRFPEPIRPTPISAFWTEDVAREAIQKVRESDWFRGRTA